MLGKTHMAVGVAASLIIVHPATLPELILGTGVAAIGGVISDIDIGTSDSRKELNKIICLVAAAVVMIAASEYIWNLGIYQKLIMKYSSNTRIYGSILAFIMICMFGMLTPHRSFMHSFLSAFLLSGCVEVFLPMMLPYFGIAYLSHLSLDLLNKKREKLFYPIRRGFCLGLCSSKGLVNKFIFLIGTVIALSLVMVYVAVIMKWI